MKAVVLGTRRVVEFSCINREGKQLAGAIMHKWGVGFCGYDDELDMLIIKWADARWWINTLARIEKLEAVFAEWDKRDGCDVSTAIMILKEMECIID